MKYKIEADRIVFTIDEDERAVLQHVHDDDPEHFDTDDVMFNWFEGLVCNSELHWCHPLHTGDLTDAPMLCILGEADPNYNWNQPWVTSKLDAIGSGHIMGCPILQRWAFMNYCVRTPQRDLLETGTCTWQGGDFMENTEADQPIEVTA
jgi:hypothetical protein